MKKTKIVCTIGPASSSPGIIQKLIKAGTNVCRLNFSHGDQDQHARTIRRIRKIAASLGQPVAVLTDLAGPKIRIGEIAGGSAELKVGRKFTLTALTVSGDETQVSVNYRKLPRLVRKRDRILLGDGALELEVVSRSKNKIVCRVIRGGTLNPHKGVNLPSRPTGIPILTEKDRRDLEFAVRQGVDYIGLSFVRTASDVRKVRRLIGERGGDIFLIAKIEKPEAVENIAEIVKVVDGIMVARGDLGVEIPFEQVPLAQKTIINQANLAGKPVITATQMMASMVNSPRPTRAEVADVTGAILEGTDAVMLSEESAVGRYPVEAVLSLSRIAREAERNFPCREWTGKFDQQGEVTIEESVARAACALSEDIKADCLITHTASGSAARRVAKYRPFHHILAPTSDRSTYRQLALTWGVFPLLIPPTDDFEVMILRATRAAQTAGLLKKGQKVVVTAGVPLNRPGHTNVIRVITVGEPDKTF
jgi:pyruvate kinase